MKHELVIVIDPGHGGAEGGADDGASYDGITERYINVATAKAMYEELSTYEGVTVYLTHDSPDTQMSLRERAEFAKSVNADYLISIHYNASEEHIFYGSEVWIPSTGSHYVQGYQLGTAILDEFCQMGLVNRGVKTKVNASGSDYYGIIRESESLGIPGIIVEHCYLDHENDLSYRDAEEDYVRFGIADATGLAKSLGLKNSKTGVDYSSYVNIEVPIPETIMYQDLTPPEQCVVQLENLPEETGTINLIIRASDQDSSIVYYSYSLDGGSSFSNLLPWEDFEENTMHVSISDITTPEVELMIKVYNEYNLETTSEILSIQCFSEENIESETGEITTTADASNLPQKNTEPSKSIAVIVLFLLILVNFVLTGLFFKHRRKKNKNQKTNQY